MARGKKSGPKVDSLLTKKDLALFYEVSNAIHGIRDLDEMLGVILENIQKGFNSEGASIALHDTDQGEFRFIRTVEEAKGKGRAHKKQLRFPDHLGIAGWVFKEKRSAVIKDVSKDERYFKGGDLWGDFVTQSMICCPLMTQRAFIGVLYAMNKQEGHFSSKNVSLLETLSGTIAIAIENAKLYGDLQQQASSLEQENRLLRSEVQSRFNLQGIVGASPAMQRLFTLLEKVVDTGTPVLIQGETGTGKELIARAIHYSGPAKDKPFVAENCGALSEPLLESELFGHTKGAFTGAMEDKKGLFELADGGTVFLDEVGEMSPAMQVRLLRVLQEGQLRPVGGSRYRKVDVRLLTATNRNLEDEVKQGRFREDLFYRIHVFPIILPPLRERTEDIPLLADHFQKKFAGKFKRPALLSNPAIDLFIRYDWPGNVRELENEILRAMTLAGDAKKITKEHLSEKIRAPANPIPLSENKEGSLQNLTEQLEQRLILETLNQTKGNRSETARRLGLSRQGLINKLTRYNIQGT